MMHISSMQTGSPPKTPPAAFGARLRELREEANLSQREVADVLGISQPSYAKWERREVAITASQLRTLADTLRCEVTDFFTDDEPKRKPGPTGRAKRTFEEVSQLPRHHQRHILDVLETMMRVYQQPEAAEAEPEEAAASTS